MAKFMMEIENGVHYVEAANMAEALECASTWVDEGDWSKCSGEVCVRVTEMIDGEEGDWECTYVDITQDAEEPFCEQGDSHEWESPYEIVGGCKENPGMWSEGSSLTVKRCCSNCGMYKVTKYKDYMGSQETIEYGPACEESLKWVEENSNG